MDEARVEEIAADAARFTAALAGTSEPEDSKPGAREEALRQESAARTAEGKRLQAERNRYVWALSGLNRQVVERAHHVYRRDEAALAEFVAYTAPTGRAKAGAAEKPAEKPAEPAAEKPPKK